MFIYSTFHLMKNKGELLSAYLQNFNDCCIFLHNTKGFEIVENILNEGFVFESQLSHSTDRVNPNEPIEVAYFLLQRKNYGLYTVIIAVPKIIFDIYTAISNEYNLNIEDVITFNDPGISDNEEPLYTISPKHVLGYFNQRTGEFYRNKHWDPLYNNCQARPVKR